MEITTTMTLEVTVVEKQKSEAALPFGASDENELARLMKERLDCDDLHIENLKQFQLDKEDVK